MKQGQLQYHYFLIFLSLVFFLLTFTFFGQPIEPGLDSSWKLAQNYFFSHDVRIGRDVIGSYGPLGFLTNPMPVGSNLAIAFWFEVLVRLSLVLLFVYLFLEDRIKKITDTIVPFLLLVALLFIVNRGEKTPGMELVALSLGLVFFSHKHRRPAFVIASVGVTALALLIKFSIGILCLSFLSVYCLREVIRERNFLRPALIFAGVFLLCAFFWLLIYGDLQGLGDYVAGSMQQSRGYSSAMTSLGSSDKSELIVSPLLILLVLLYTVRKDRSLLFLFLLFSPGLIITFKYGVTKQPQFLFTYALFMLFFLTGQARTLTRQGIITGIMALFIFSLDPGGGFLNADAFNFDTAEPLVKPVRLGTTLRQFVDFKAYEHGLRDASDMLLKPARLEDQTVSLIGGGTVDTYPWEISFIPANRLNWRPRPVFQSYFAYTPWLDSRNEAFFLSARAPQFLLWDTDRADSMQSIDGRYLLNDEPLTALQILSRYSFVKVDGNAAVFEKRTRPALRGPVVFSSSGPLAWNTGFEVPYADNGIVRARLHFRRTFLGRLRAALYKENPVFVDYLFDSGEVAHCRLVLDNAVSGIWSNPFVVSLLQPYSAAKVVGMKIVNPDAESGSYYPRFSVDWELAAFDGPPDPYLRRK